MQNKTLSYSREQNEITGTAFRSFMASLSGNEKAFAQFSDSKEIFERILRSMEHLYESVSDISPASDPEGHLASQASIIKISNADIEAQEAL
jgi:hypothetical protein